MCGLAGVVELDRNRGAGDLESRVEKMLGELIHRGPDDAGTWSDPSLGVALGLRRLAILDLSPSGRQPMCSEDGRWTIVFNGEIFNFRELREELEERGHRFRGRSDTEVLLAAVATWGIRGAAQRCNGMFAVAVVDAVERRLHLARDRVGEKPLYLARMGTSLLFGSEIKALRCDRAFSADIDRQAVLGVLRRGVVPGNRSMYRGVHPVRPGAILTFSLGGPVDPSEDVYWSARAEAAAGFAAPFTGSASEAAEETERLLSAAVRRRLVADVPVGALLSGGIDSSLVVAAMSEAVAGSVRTFTVGFHEGGHDEAAGARRVASALGTEHHELYVSASEVVDLVPSLASVFDEPFADPAAIPTMLVSRLASGSIKVGLGGDGGDELFGGYPHHLFAAGPWRLAEALPQAARHLAASLLARNRNVRSIRALAELLPIDDAVSLHRRLTSQWKEPSALLEVAVDELRTEPDVPEGPMARQLMFLDIMGYLPDDILVKTDRATMWASLEGRLPFVDHELLAFSFRLPVGLLLGPRHGKLVLRRIVERQLGPTVSRAPKRGFRVPIGDWLRGPLRPWAEELLSPPALSNAGLRSEPIWRCWQEHLAGRRDGQYYLWNVLMLSSWFRS